VSLTSVAYTDGTNEQVLVIFSHDSTTPVSPLEGFTVDGIPAASLVSGSYNGCIMQLGAPGSVDAPWAFSPTTFELRSLAGWPYLTQSGSVTAAPP
jgi:hypothetical protein